MREYQVRILSTLTVDGAALTEEIIPRKKIVSPPRRDLEDGESRK